MDRRAFLKFLGFNAAALSVGSLTGCSKQIENVFSALTSSGFDFEAIVASAQDELVLPKGFSYQVIRSWGDSINDKENFGTNNDFTSFFPLNEKEALLWVNHEGIDTRLIPDIKEQELATGGSVIAIEKIDGEWQYSENLDLQKKYNRRYHAKSMMEYSGPAAGHMHYAYGTLANCSGGKTPWNTVLTCEENFDHFPDKYHWQNFDRTHYGWVVEIDPYDKELVPIKHTALGRFAHENASLSLSKGKKLVVYMGDDSENEHIYKYVSHDSFDGNNGSLLLANGDLYAAKLDQDAELGTWLHLSINDPVLADEFEDQAELLIETRKAAKLLGATEMHRPEDLEIAADGSIYVALTKNISKLDFHGSILKINERDNDHESLHFSFERFLMGGDKSGLSCPDNMVFDKFGNLWVTTDISTPMLNKMMYEYHGNNSLFFIPIQGEEAGLPKRFASAPNGAELTGPSFSEDGNTLFLSVQHPHSWAIKDGKPRSSVVAIKLKT